MGAGTTPLNSCPMHVECFSIHNANKKQTQQEQAVSRKTHDEIWIGGDVMSTEI